MIRFALIVVWLLTAGNLSAQEEKLWYAVTDTGKSVEMSKVDMLVATDDNYTFAIVSADGTVLIDDVAYIQLVQSDTTPSGIIEARKDDNMRLIHGVVSSQLVLTGAKGRVSIYSANGTQVLSVQASEDGETSLNVRGLPHGVYVVKCGKASFKFIKK